MLDGGRVVDQGTHDELTAAQRALPRAAVRARRGAAARGRRPDRGARSRSPRRRRPGAAPPVAHRRSPAARASLGAGLGGGGGGIWQSASPPTPELLGAVAALPPVRDAARVDLAARERAPTASSRWCGCCASSARPLLLGLVLVVLDALAGLAGPYLVKTGIDNGVATGSRGVLFAAAGRVPRRHARRPAGADRLDLRHRPHGRADHALAAHPHLGAAAAPLARLLRARDGRPDHDPDDHRRRPVRVAGDQRPAVRARRVRDRSSASASRCCSSTSSSGWSRCRWSIPLALATVVVPAPGRDALRPVPRTHRRRQRRLPGEPVRRPRVAGVRARGGDRRALPRARRVLPATRASARSGWWRPTSRSCSSCPRSPTRSCSVSAPR